MSGEPMDTEQIKKCGINSFTKSSENHSIEIIQSRTATRITANWDIDFKGKEVIKMTINAIKLHLGHFGEVSSESETEDCYMRVVFFTDKEEDFKKVTKSVYDTFAN